VNDPMLSVYNVPDNSKCMFGHQVMGAHDTSRKCFAKGYMGIMIHGYRIDLCLDHMKGAAEYLGGIDTLVAAARRGEKL